MTVYWKLKYDIKNKSTRAKCIEGIQRLRQAIYEQLPKQTTDESLIIGTWNIRNFDDNRFGFGPREHESFYYIAEIISAFDIIAVQEICHDLEGLRVLMNVLGPNYDYLITDATMGRSGSNERLGFIYDKRKVNSKGIAGEIVLPRKDLISAETGELQFSRTPFCCYFQSSWLKSMLATVHIYYGKSSKQTEAYKHRISEMEGAEKPKSLPYPEVMNNLQSLYHIRRQS